MEHDERCTLHDEALKIIRDRSHILANEVVVSQTKITQLQDAAREASELLVEIPSLKLQHTQLEGWMKELSDRTQILVAQTQDQSVKQAVMQADVLHIMDKLNFVVMSLTSEIESLKGLLKSEFVRTGEFSPVRNIVYGMVMLILTAVITALITLVIR